MTAFQSKVQEHVRTWGKRLHDRKWWPRWVYHFTDVSNAVSILDAGKLYSRTEALRLGLVRTDSASQEVIAQTAAAHRAYARLYFRPRTPTQYRNEGIRPKAKIWSGAHCPVPVFLCFGTARVLCLEGTEISDGNMGSSRVEHAPAPEIFDRIPFRHVFHDGPVAHEEVETIKFHRHAEVLVPGSLALDPSLEMIVCRSPAERTTLLSMLSEPARTRWAPFVRIDHQDLFERRWVFVESVATMNESIVFRFNPNGGAQGPFQVDFFYGVPTGRFWRWARQIEALGATWTLRLNGAGATRGVATLKLDDCTAFQGAITFDDLPF